MKVLVTGANGFVGKNLVATLKTLGYEFFCYGRSNTLEELKDYASQCDVVVHLAGVNRPERVSDFYEGNASFTEVLVNTLESVNNIVPIIASSSIQAAKDNDYGKSKLMGEDILQAYSQRNDVSITIYRFTNLYGKWSKPNYNSVIATWSYNIARDLDVVMNDPRVEISLNYIDDVVHELIRAINGTAHIVDGFGVVEAVDTVSLQTIYDLLVSFKESRVNFIVPNLETRFSKNLYSTYLSYLPEDDFSYPLISHIDDRGSFSEFLRLGVGGQVSVNISKPGITKGQHWHHTKNEKFLVVSGQGEINFRNIHNDKIISYKVSDKKLEVVDIPVGYTHNIINTGDRDMITIMWVNEVFDKDHPDTYFEEV